MYKHLLRPLLFKLSPETAHRLILSLLGLLHRIPLAASFMKLLYRRRSSLLPKEVFGLEFPNPVGLAAGLDKNGERYNELSWFGFSFIEIGSLTPEAQDGNPRPRLFRLPRDRALVNRMGINNKGVRSAIGHLTADPPQTIIAASIAKNTSSHSDEEIQKDYETSFSLLYDFVDLFTINLSCPNVEGLQNLQDVSFLSDILDPLLALRLCYDTCKPVLVKISPDLPFSQVDEILQYCMMSGIDGIVAGNTTRSREGLRTPPDKVERLGDGGLSGAPLYPGTLALVKHIHAYTKGRLPIVACGGIMTPVQAQEMLDAGASLIELYTGFIYEGPSLVRKIIKQLLKPARKK